MKTTALRRISLMLAAILAVSQIAACGSASSSDTPANDTASDTTAETTPALTGRAAEKDNLPENDFGGQTFTILGREAFATELVAEEENGDTLNDAIYKRNTNVEDRFNVQINPVLMDHNEVNAHLLASVLADTGAYDLVAGYAYLMPSLILSDIFVNWNEVKYIDMDQPWWSKQVSNELTVNGICYTITGDLAISLWEMFFTFTFNKKLAAEYNLGDLYEIVRSGNWTLDKLSELTANTYKDLDGDTKQSWNDAYGFVAGHSTPVDAFKEAFKVDVTTMNSDGIPEYTLANEKTTDVLTRLNAFFYTEGNSMVIGGSDEAYAAVDTAFKEGRAIFQPRTLANIAALRDMNDDFGILPYPKLDAEQDKYYSTAMDNYSLLLLPIDAADYDFTGFITEALCAESYRVAVPAYYDVVLKTKAARDDESAEMLDIVRDGVTFNFGYAFSGVLNMVGHIFQEKIKAKNDKLVSTFTAGQKIYQRKLDEVLVHYGVE